jgi:integrase
VHVALYLTYLLDQGSTFHPINNALYSIKWAHEINGLPDPTKYSFVSSIQEAAKRTAYKKVVKKEPISVNMLIELCDKFINGIDLLVIRDLTMILIGFAGFLRLDELSSLKFNDVQVKEQFLVLHINKSKTEQARE